MNKNFYCIIMAGGYGAKFWPVSRNSRPKQFQCIPSSDKSMFRLTFERFCKFIPAENIIVITSVRYRDIIFEEVPEINPENVLLEPYSRGTAPCIAYATYTVLKRNPDAVMIVSPADQLVLDVDAFRDTLSKALNYACRNEVLITLGIVPTSPDTNYGYIQIAGGKDACSDGKPVKVKTFTEKPDASLAKVFINSGEFYWNSGIFVWQAETIRVELEKYLPEITRLFAGWENAIGSHVEREFIESAYTDCLKISIDYGVMEKTERAWLYPAKFGWFDFSSWESLHAGYPAKDENDNAVNADCTLLENCEGNIFVTQKKGKLIAAKDLSDYVVIDTEDVLLVCPKDEKKFKDFISGIGMPGYEQYR